MGAEDGNRIARCQRNRWPVAIHVLSFRRASGRVDPGDNPITMSKMLIPGLMALLSISCSCRPGAEGAGAPAATVATDAKAELVLDKAPT